MDGERRQRLQENITNAESLESHATDEAIRGAIIGVVGSVAIANSQDFASHESPIVQYGGLGIGITVAAIGVGVVLNSVRNHWNAQLQRDRAQAELDES